MMTEKELTNRGRVIEEAVRHLGLTENPAGSNKIIFNTWFYGREVFDGDKPGAKYPWCLTYCMWVYAMAGLPFPKSDWLRGYAYVPNLKKARKNEITTTPHPGDLALFEFNGKPEPDHIGIFDCWEKEGKTFWCIEGNTSAKGSQDNGGVLLRQLRSVKLVDCFISPRELKL